MAGHSLISVRPDHRLTQQVQLSLMKGAKLGGLISPHWFLKWGDPKINNAQK